MSAWNDDIKTAPYQQIVWVKNDVMAKPVMATRGFTTEHGVHPDNTIFTSVFTPIDRFMPMPAGRMVCPNKWRHLDKVEEFDADTGNAGIRVIIFAKPNNLSEQLARIQCLGLVPSGPEIQVKS